MAKLIKIFEILNYEDVDFKYLTSNFAVTNLN